ncbi:MAG: 4-hydroxy-tetrahydrodipicolinate synthase [Bacteroidetes bacterium]|nr:4-hydroxy-tetrahydrodipicolinate synthase [Bacteroidota bacterium]MDA1224891.1 4-hydroxy-tetrahydrodipicolinate synthase [Bacteroidota bacterium]
MKELIGTGTALITPFNNDHSIDFDALSRIIEQQIAGGTNYFVMLGTTGESATLSSQEKSAVVSHIKKVNAGRLPLVLGVGGNNTSDVVEQLKSLDTDGLTAILSVSPYYNKPNQQGIIYHYTEVANASPLPIILYNVPGRTGSNMTASTQLELARHPNIVATKEASGDMEQVMSILKDKPADFLVISGDDGLTFPILACGGSGVISVINHIFPRTFSGMVKSALQGDIIAARAAHERVLESSIAIFADGSPGGIKTMLNEKQLCGTAVRPPLWQVNDQVDQNLRKLAHIAD